MRFRHIGNNETPPLTEKLFNRLKNLAPQGVRPAVSRAYGKLCSVTTAICVLGIFVIFYIVGSIFPQGENIEEYIKAGGKSVFLVKTLHLLDLFSSPLFLLAAFILFLNLLVSGYERLKNVSYRPYGAFTPTHRIPLAMGLSEAHPMIKEAVRKMRFRVKSKNGEWTVVEKGLDPQWLTLLYHLGIFVCLIGFGLTFLFAFEGSVKLKPNELTTLISENTGRLQKLWKEREGNTGVHLLLTDVMTEYIEAPALKYPKDKASRLAIGLGWKGPEFELPPDPLHVKDWRPKIKAIKNEAVVAEKLMEVNEPLEYGGYVFYLTDYRQRFRVRIDDNPILLETPAEEEFFIPSMDEPLVIGPYRKGLVTRLDGTVETLNPYISVKYRRPSDTGAKLDEIGRVELGSSIEAGRRHITIADMEEEIELRYRYDPGVGLLWAGGLLTLAAMSLRFYGRWYRAAYTVDESETGPALLLCLSSKGLGADADRLKRTIERFLAAPAKTQ